MNYFSVHFLPNYTHVIYLVFPSCSRAILITSAISSSGDLPYSPSFPFNALSSIEVIRGFGSSLWGDNGVDFLGERIPSFSSVKYVESFLCPWFSLIDAPTRYPSSTSCDEDGCGKNLFWFSSVRYVDSSLSPRSSSIGDREEQTGSALLWRKPNQTHTHGDNKHFSHCLRHSQSETPFAYCRINHWRKKHSLSSIPHLCRSRSQAHLMFKWPGHAQSF